MKHRRSDIRSQAHAIPELRFQEQKLTSFSGLVLFQQLFTNLDLKARLRACFRHQAGGEIFERATLFLQFIVHLLLGFRELRECQAYADDPMVKRVVGLERLPDVSTLSRMLKDADEQSVENLRRLLRDMIFARLATLGLHYLTLDFDGSVQSTRRRAQGTAVGYNKKRKGARSYYPLFCTIAQVGQVLDFLHRSGNVHDSQGAREFILACVQEVRQALPRVRIEVRMDSAFFSDAIVSALQKAGVEFTISVPFERFTQLKKKIEDREYWFQINRDVFYFEEKWKPAKWDRRFRFLFIRTRTLRQRKQPVQLDLFIPHDTEYDFKVIVTNKTLAPDNVVKYHEGRGAQENIFGELKTCCQMDYVPVRRLIGNQLYLLAGLFAHNLTREMQMAIHPSARKNNANRAALWMFQKLDTLRNTIFHRAGQFSKPKNRLTLTINNNPWLRQHLPEMLHKLKTCNPAESC